MSGLKGVTKEHMLQKKIENDKKILDFINENSIRGNYLKLVPRSSQAIFHRAYTGSKSKADSIKAKCLDCSQFDRDEIKKCPVVTCPLWNIRPFQGK